MIKIELYNPDTGKTETITEDFVPSRSLRKVLEFGAKVEEGELTELEQLDEIITLVASLFRDERVTFDSILDGIPADKLDDTLNGILENVLGGEVEKKQAQENLKQVTK